MFPGAGARIFRNEAGEPVGWDYPDPYEPFDPDRYDEPSELDHYLEDQYDLGYSDGEEGRSPNPPTHGPDQGKDAYNDGYADGKAVREQ